MLDDPKTSKDPSVVPGLAVFGCFAVGVLGLILAVFSRQSGLCLLASALAFGIVVHVSYQR